MNEKNFRLNATLESLFPVLAIRMATRVESARNFLSKTENVVHEEHCCEPADPLYCSKMAGDFTDAELEQYRQVYSVLKGSLNDDRKKREVLCAWKKENPEIEREMQEMKMVEYNKVINLGIYFSSKRGKIYAADALCAIALLLEEGFSFESTLFTTILFYGGFLEKFSRDCDVDSDLHQLFAIPNSVILRKHLLSEMKIKQTIFSDKTKEIENSLSFGMEYMLEDIFIQTSIENGYNPNIFKRQQPDRGNKLNTDSEMKRRCSIKDRFNLSKEENTILNKVKFLLDIFALQSKTIAQPKQKEEVSEKPDEPVLELELLNDEMERKVSELRRRVKILECESRIKQNEVNKVKKALEEQRKYCYELEEEKRILEKALFDLIDEPVESSYDFEITEEALNELWNSKGVIVGGHRNLINKLLSYLPQWTVIEVERGVKNDWNTLKGASLIIINTEYISHGIYNQAMRSIKDKSSIIFNRQNNVVKILQKVYEKIAK